MTPVVMTVRHDTLRIRMSRCRSNVVRALGSLNPALTERDPDLAAHVVVHDVLAVHAVNARDRVAGARGARGLGEATVARDGQA
jgi:hypothetical protein